MRIYIPTYGRVHNQRTWASLSNVLKVGTQLVCYKEEEKDLRKLGYPVLVYTGRKRGIQHKRQWIIDHHDKTQQSRFLVMMDDDLTFARRRADDPTKFVPAMATSDFLGQIQEALENYAHVGVMSREGANRQTQNQEATRMTRVLAYDVAAYKELGIRFDRLAFKTDFDVTLQFLEKGRPNLVLAAWVHDQAGSNASGGCSSTRDEVALVKAAEELHQLHPETVKVVQKTTKTAWGGGTRTDVVIQWKKALRSAS